MVGLCLLAQGLFAAGGPAAAQSSDGVAAQIAAALESNDAKALSGLLDADFDDQSEDFLGDGGILRQLAELDAAIPGASVEIHVATGAQDVVAISRTVSGVATAPLFGQQPVAAPLAFDAMDFFTIKNGRIVSRRGVIDSIAALRQLTMPLPAPAPLHKAKVTEITRFDPGQFPEGLIGDGEGGLLLTMLFDNKILSVSTQGEMTTFAELPFTADPRTQQGTMCIAKGPDGAIYVTVLSRSAQNHGLWRLETDGSARLVASMPQGTVPNGVDVDDKGRVYVADSSGGVWRWRPGDASAQKWLASDLVSRRPFIGNLPGPNGLKVHNKSVYVAVSDTAAFVRIPIRKNGDAGDAQLIAYGVPGDDFAMNADGDAYVTTHPFNSVLKVTRDGVEAVVADIEDGVVGPTTAAFVETQEGKALYVVTDGGLYAPAPGADIIPRLLRIEVD